MSSAVFSTGAPHKKKTGAASKKGASHVFGNRPRASITIERTPMDGINAEEAVHTPAAALASKSANRSNFKQRRLSKFGAGH